MDFIPQTAYDVRASWTLCTAVDLFFYIQLYIMFIFTQYDEKQASFGT